ncbi:MAG: hypothetical protein IKO57_14120 [Treponema sp.]|nr:hypothetical protein [Treponema sp.]
MATSSIFANIRIESQSVIKEFVDSYEKHEEKSSCMQRPVVNHIVSSANELRNLLNKRFNVTK